MPVNGSSGDNTRGSDTAPTRLAAPPRLRRPDLKPLMALRAASPKAAAEPNSQKKVGTWEGADHSLGGLRIGNLVPDRRSEVSAPEH